MDIFSSITKLNFSTANDWALMVIFLALAVVYGLAMGRGRLIVVTLGVYFSLILVRAVPWTALPVAKLDKAPDSNIQIFLFLAAVIGFYFLIPNSAFRLMIKTRGRHGSAWWQSLVLSVLQIGLILSVVVSFLPEKVIAGLSPLARILMVGQLSQFLWLLLPILAMMFLRQRHHEIAD